ncbi:hypothetical protein IscW_ISCW023067 [Ixodes scapularis]|uniref:Uncharacterized protein n=1 Tax=Ixodes scapularis TaxID=6945 RepID=B7QLY0_IXOSC|nr:hypothetical protein IscW_ISCW023067 [Ixodes scapularis]|eukprot:XP_002416185.1 hypothetical protein IscW_ISCW023067 [Ixodes scapularis]
MPHYIPDVGSAFELAGLPFLGPTISKTQFPNFFSFFFFFYSFLKNIVFCQLSGCHGVPSLWAYDQCDRAQSQAPRPLCSRGIEETSVPCHTQNVPVRKKCVFLSKK